MNNYLKYVVILLLFGALVFGLHYLILNSFGQMDVWDGTGYSLQGLYVFGTIASAVVTVIVLMAQFAMPKNVGFVFLGLLTIKIVAGYIFIKNGFDKFDGKFLEYNFLSMFFAFLCYDVFLTYMAINSDVKTGED